MELPLTFKFHGWSIRYNLLVSDKATTIQRAQRAPVKCVVFVHGTPWSSAVFQPVVEALQAKGSYKILVYDLPGYGQSQEFDSGSTATARAGFPGDTSVKFQAKALAELCKYVQLDGKEGCPIPAVIAHDIAGAIVLRAHLLEGCDFDTIMLVDANVVLPWGDGFFKQVRSDPQAYVKMPPNIFEAVVRAVIQSACYNPKVLQTGWEDILAQPWIGCHSAGAETDERQRSFIRQIAQANDQDVADMLVGDLYGCIRCHIKIVWGKQDQWIPREKVEDSIRRMSDKVMEHVFIPNAGHLVMLDQPERFAIEVFDWLIRFGTPRSLIEPLTGS